MIARNNRPVKQRPKLVVVVVVVVVVGVPLPLVSISLSVLTAIFQVNLD